MSLLTGHGVQAFGVQVPFRLIGDVLLGSGQI